MAKVKTIFACQSCGYQSPKWLGKCPDCNQWNTFAEERFEKATTARGELTLGTKEDPAPIHKIDISEEGRVLSGIGEFDRVLGGGLVPGSVILIGRPGDRQVNLAAAGVRRGESERLDLSLCVRRGIAAAD